MDKLSIKVKIADREYPMKISEGEEENIRSAARLINERLKLYKEQFGIEDKQDLLAMVTFEVMVDLIKVKGVSNAESKQISGKLDELNDLIAQSL